MKNYSAKITSLALTILSQLLLLLCMGFLDGILFKLFLFVGCLVVGIFLATDRETTQERRDVGWGMIVGSVVSLTGTISFLLWLFLHFSID